MTITVTKPDFVEKKMKIFLACAGKFRLATKVAGIVAPSRLAGALSKRWKVKVNRTTRAGAGSTCRIERIYEKERSCINLLATNLHRLQVAL
jgi:hypothetical protein